MATRDSKTPRPLLAAGPCLVLGLVISLGSSGCRRTKDTSTIHPRLDPPQLQATLSTELKTLKGWKVSAASLGADHRVLMLDPATDAKHPAVLLVGCAPSTDDGTELAVQIRLISRRVVTKPARAEVRRLVNEHHARNWAGTFFLDENGELMGQWTLNLPDRPLDVAFVRDAVLRLHQSWLELEVRLPKL